jgi:hypothetical protein
MLIEKDRDRTPVPANGSHRYTDSEQATVREQMLRMLAHSLFRNSKRYPPLFRFVVESTLQDQTDTLKERSLGVKVFGREPDYDTNLDPIVRYTAGEIRKRIAQYYHFAEHQDELRIELPSGSYVPEFHFPAPAPEPSVPAPAAPVAPLRSRVPLRSRWWLAGIVCLVALAAVLLWQKTWQRGSALDRFWSPVFSSNGPVTICLAPPVLVPSFNSPDGTAQRGSPESNDASARKTGAIGYGDAITLARITGLLQAKGRLYRFSDQSYLDLADLKQGPIVLIGGFNNAWTVRLTNRLRFVLALDKATATTWIKDNQNPGRRDWSVRWVAGGPDVAEDYAVVSRFFDPNTGRLVVAIAGITGVGTLAAGEFVTDNRLTEALASRAPANWEHRSFQVVLATRIIQGSDAMPRIVATHFW